MLRLIGANPLPRRTAGWVAGAIVGLAVGFVLNLIGTVTGTPWVGWAGDALIALGAVAFAMAIRRAAAG